MDLNQQNVQEQPKKKSSGYVPGFVTGILCSAFIVLIVGLVMLVYHGYTEDEKQWSKEKEESREEKEVVIDDDMLEKMDEIEELIEKYYYEDDIDESLMEEGAYRGMVDALGDPYTVYYTPEELQELMEQTTGIYYGIGAYVGLDTVTGYPKIVNPIAGAPAEEADLRPDDIIYEVDGVSTYGKDLESVVAMIKGAEGTKVTLTIVRSTETDYMYVEVERRQVETPTIETEMLEDGIAYIQITEFSETTVDQFADALAVARESGMKGLIIDLRANPGGSLSAVVDIARMLLPKGLVTYTEDKYGTRKEYSCDGKHEFDLPLVVLVDGNSASASEVLAGAIKDYGIGTLVGTTTFGKGIVQQIIGMDDGSALKVTVSSYYSPKGNNIHGTGIEPDLECEFDAEAYYGEEAFDNQLDYAKDVLRDMMK